MVIVSHLCGNPHQIFFRATSELLPLTMKNRRLQSDPRGGIFGDAAEDAEAYFTLLLKLIEDASLKYFVGQLSSPIVNPK